MYQEKKHFVFGKEYTLDVKIGRKNSVSLCDDKLILSIKDEDQDREQIVARELRKMLYDMGLKFINKHEKIMGVHAEQFRIKKDENALGVHVISKRKESG